MKINNKGFMLIEAIIISTIVLTSLLSLYSGFSKLYNNSKTKNTYYDIDGVYAAKSLIKSMIVSYNINANFNSFITNQIADGSLEEHFLIKERECKIASDEYANNSCNQIKNLYNINNLVLLEYDTNSFNNIRNKVSNQTFKEYVDYLSKYYASDISNADKKNKYSYIVLVEYGNDNNYNYSNLRLR